MFEVVVNARPGQRLWQRPDALAASAMLHGLAVYALLSAPGRPLPAPLDFDREMATFLDILSQPPQLERTLVEGEGSGGAALKAVVAPAPPPPSSIALANIPLDLPRIDAVLPSASTLEVVSVDAFGDFEGAAGLGNRRAMEEAEERLNGTSGGVAIVTEGGLAERPRVLNRFEMEELWRRLYPPLLNMKGIAGDAVVSFVINIDGRVDPGTIQMLSTSHPEFIVATITGVKKLRFHPAQLNGNPVRVRAVMPVHWRPEEI